MTALILHLQLETACLFSGMGNGDENSSRSLPYIPGSALRGALVARFGPAGKDLPVEEKSRRLFFDGSVRYLNAYLASDTQWTRSLPRPASWRKRKNDDLEGAVTRDFALKADKDFDTQVRVSFVAQESTDTWLAFNPEEQLLTHTGAEKRGTVKKGESMVFQYQALAQGQMFVAVILCAEQRDTDELKKLLDQNKILSIGRSHSASYGRVRIEKIVEQETWPEFEPGRLQNKTIITLLSDALLRDGTGQPTFDMDACLSAWLNRTVKRISAFIQPAAVGGFNRKWGLPLPQSPALGMGSVFVYDATELSATELQPLVEQGIGERRVEGFGRLAVNWPALDSVTLHNKPDSGVTPQVVPLSDTSKELARKMSERLLRHALENRLVEQAQHYTIQGDITNHQLARLRGVVRAAINEHSHDIFRVQTFLGQLKKTAQEQYAKPRVKRDSQGGERLKDWLDERLKESDGLYYLQFYEADVPQVAGEKAVLQDLKQEYTLRFIEAVIDRRMKENKE